MSEKPKESRAAKVYIGLYMTLMFQISHYQLHIFHNRKLLTRERKSWPSGVHGFQHFPWLHISEANNVVCFRCSKANKLSLLSLPTQNEATFIEKGYINWKNATERFEKHERSACHSHAIHQLQQLQRPSVCAQLSQQSMLNKPVSDHILCSFCLMYFF